ncbi:transcriptional regulator Rok [Bacillus cereus]|uniref:Uncharacterized protein n=1 Tax=Bacillus cereus TaxID=1396 RepID=A0A164LEZ0_BACCE|nr:hypothetical protein [Bacillus cereus]KZD55744.1 hypothetical protein B4088_5489 [Bacillus cereus]
MPFNEREAMKLRLQQIDKSEERILLQYKKERESIFNRLRELDELSLENNTNTNNQSKKTISHEKNSTKKRKSVGRPKKDAKLTNEDKVAIKFLKYQTAAIGGADIMQELYNKTGINIRNTTYFMDNLMALEPRVKKPYRGLYIYEHDDLHVEKNT